VAKGQTDDRAGPFGGASSLAWKPDAITALAMIEFCLARSPSGRSQLELNDLVDDWGRTLLSVDAADVERMKRQLGQIREFSGTFPPLLE
jgi:hypothetical protein